MALLYPTESLTTSSPGSPGPNRPPVPSQPNSPAEALSLSVFPEDGAPSLVLSRGNCPYSMLARSPCWDGQVCPLSSLAGLLLLLVLSLSICSVLGARALRSGPLPHLGTPCRAWHGVWESTGTSRLIVAAATADGSAYYPWEVSCREDLECVMKWKRHWIQVMPPLLAPS